MASNDVPLLIDEPASGKARLTIVLAHGAGAAMDSAFMNDVAGGLARASFRVARFEFPYMQKKRETGARTRPDVPAVLEATWMKVVAQLGEPSRIVIGGKSMGGRIASMVADRAGVRGLLCLGYPFHPAGAPGKLRVSHLKDLKTPTLFLQGERDALGSRDEIAGYELAPAIRVLYLPDGDHSFKPRASSGATYRGNIELAIREAVAFCAGL
ncbi:MAG TPA: alpha/beta family hydrolase [Spirochaetia bacterium]|nr:alpha/beta family hydrolase [Spirochaetia bacterium]